MCSLGSLSWNLLVRPSRNLGEFEDADCREFLRSTLNFFGGVQRAAPATDTAAAGPPEAARSPQKRVWTRGPRPPGHARTSSRSAQCDVLDFAPSLKAFKEGAP